MLRRDLLADPRFCLHTATVDTHVADGDAKVWGTVQDVPDEVLHQRYAENLFAETGFDLRGQVFETDSAAKTGTQFEIECRGEKIPAEVVGRPFWKDGSVKKAG